EPPLVAAGGAGGELVTLEEDDGRAATSKLVSARPADDAPTDDDHVRHGCSVSIPPIEADGGIEPLTSSPPNPTTRMLGLRIRLSVSASQALATLDPEAH